MSEPKQEETALATQEPREISIVSIIDKISQTPALSLESIGVLERLVALQERRDEQSRKERFYEALARVQAQVKPVEQNGLMDRGTGGKIPYAKREDIRAMIRPLYIAEGFTVTWDAPTSDDSGNIHVQGSFTCCGHTEKREWTCKPDPSGGKTGPQAVSSTIAYGKRQVEKMFWDVEEKGLDRNGARPEDVTAISQEQADTIRSLIGDLPNSASYMKKALALYEIKRIEDLRLSQLDDIHARIKSVKAK